ncbi:MAG: hypothetical protein R3362_11540 [Rhodothermales bacterium]|nr:hypothetical protein [Rhodothermales bacterium]
MSRPAAGAVAGAVAGLLMAVTLMVFTAAAGQGPWTIPNLIAATWLGPDAADGVFGAASVVGFATHLGASAALGVAALPFIYGLPPMRTVLVALVYALATFPVVFAFVLTWANPLLIARSHLVSMTLAHGVFGIALGVTYLRFRGRISVRGSWRRVFR